MPGTSGKSKGKGREARRSRSRNTTPISTGTAASVEQSQSNLLQTPVTAAASLGSLTYDDMLERFCRGASAPASINLKKMLDGLKHLSTLAHDRSENCDRGMRELSKRRKEVIELAREEERAHREAEERREREKTKKNKLKREREDERPLAIGAHSVAKQDGTSPTAAEAAAAADIPPDAPHQPAEPKTADAATSPADSDISSDSQEQPPPRAVPQYQTFGPDPSVFDDPTIYHIRDIEPFMSEEDKKAILGVAEYPHDDLHDLTPGTPPDKDFSNAKPPNQVNAQAFANYLEPYVRPLSEEDIAFFKERGDRVTPFMIPRRGTRSFKEIWAAEDGNHFTESRPSTPADGGSRSNGNPIEDMSDAAAETSSISTGPMMARLLAAMRPERRQPPGEQNATVNGSGDAVATNGDIEIDGEPIVTDQHTKPLPPATFLPESSISGWKTSSTKLDYSQIDDRLMQELKYIGFVSEDAEPDYTGHNDDEVAARLRYLQEELHRVSILNGARKARILEVVEDRMAQQEYSTIADDLDTQLNQAYLKRHRNIGKGKRNLKRPGGTGGSLGAGAGIGKPSVGEPIRSLMERRNQWNNLIGPVVDHGKAVIPSETLFDDENMNRLKARERENWTDAQEAS